MGPSDQGRSYRGGELGINCFREANLALDFRVGSKPDMTLSIRDVRFTPKTDMVQSDRDVR